MLMACPALQQAYLSDDKTNAQGPLGYALQQAFRHAAKGARLTGSGRAARLAAVDSAPGGGAASGGGGGASSVERGVGLSNWTCASSPEACM